MIRTLFALMLLVMAPAVAMAQTPSALSAADQAMVGRAAAYLQELGQASGRFVQTDPRGGQTQGMFWLKRPGKIRFEYGAPAIRIVASNGRDVIVNDLRLKSLNRYPLNFTALHVFLAKNIKLDKGVLVERVRRTAGGFEVTLRDARRQRDGSITLAFRDEGGLRLQEWTVLDPQGGRTRVQLLSLERTSGLDDRLFNNAAPTPASVSSRSGL